MSTRVTGKVADAFRRNLGSGKEIGAAVAVYRDGRKVVDLRGGYRIRFTKDPSEHDTVVICVLHDERGGRAGCGAGGLLWVPLV